jgi:hypothetical protein
MTRPVSGNGHAAEEPDQLPQSHDRLPVDWMTLPYHTRGTKRPRCESRQNEFRASVPRATSTTGKSKLPLTSPRPLFAVGGEHRAGFIEAVASKQQPLDMLAVPCPQLDLEEVAPGGDQGIVGPRGGDLAR